MDPQLPDEWFRAGHRAPTEGSERPEGSADAAGQGTGPGSSDGGQAATTADGRQPLPPTSQPGSSEQESSKQASSKPASTKQASVPPTVDEDSEAAAVRTLGSNSAGTTVTLAAVRPAGRKRRPPARAGAVRRLIQLCIVLAVSLMLGLAVGYLVATNGFNTSGVVDAGVSPGATASPSTSADSNDGPWTGAMKQIPLRAETSCDSAGEAKIRGLKNVGASNLVDASDDTAWVCAGDGQGVTITLDPHSATTVVGLGVVNGFVRRQPNGTDLYPRFRRPLEVRWTFANGQQVDQRLIDQRRSAQVIVIAPMQVSGPIQVTIVRSSDVTASGHDAVALSALQVFTKS